MKPTEIRGCCFGIPIGCGSLVLLVVGSGLWRYTGAAGFMLLGLVPLAMVVVLAASAYGLPFWRSRGRR